MARATCRRAGSCLLLAALLGPGALAEDSALETTRGTLDKWVETRRLISEEREEWRLGKELLEQRIDVIRNQIEDVQAKIDETGSGLADTDKSRRELRREDASLGAATASLGETIARLESKTRALLARAPDPIRERVEPLSQRMPASPDDTTLTLSQRFQNVIGILNEVNKFNRDVTLTSEVRKLPDGTTAEVRAVYLGLSQGYYVSASGDSAAVGRPTAEGWAWTPADELAPQVTQVVEILQSKQDPAYVPLPVEIQ